MVDSGIKVHKEVLNIMEGFNKLDKRSHIPTHDYIVLNIEKKDGDKDPMVHLLEAAVYGSSAEKYADIDTKGEPVTYYALKEVISKSESPLFGLTYVLKHRTDDTSNTRLLAICWIPNSSKVKERMTYSSTKSSLQKVLQTKILQVNDQEDLEYASVLKEIK